MAEHDREALGKRARALEESGDLAAAATAYAQVGEPMEAARLLVRMGRGRQAGDVLLASLPVGVSRYGELQGAALEIVRTAARYYARGDASEQAADLFLVIGDVEASVALLEGLGKRRRAKRLRDGHTLEIGPTTLKRLEQGPAKIRGAQLERGGQMDAAFALYERVGLSYEAARVAFKLGRHEVAGDLLLGIDRAFEAGQCLEQAGRSERALEAYTGVEAQADDAQYRAAATRAILLAVKLDDVSFRLEHFLSPFLALGDHTEAELGALKSLGGLLGRKRMWESAQGALVAAARGLPSDSQVEAQLAHVVKRLEGSAEQFAKVLEADEAFEQQDLDVMTLSEMQALPELPGLPDLPEVPAHLDTSSPQRRTSPRVKRSTHPRLRARTAPSWVDPDAAPGGTGGSSGEADPADTAASAPRDRSSGDGRLGAHTAPSQVRLGPGALFAERYLIEKKLGDGATASVYRAVDRDLGDPIAIKIFHPSISDSDVFAERMKTEIRICRQLAHPNIIRIFDIGQYEGLRYLTMELLIGQTLSEVLRASPSVSQSLRLLIQACRGLHVAHEAGVVHRDVKPDNLFVTTQRVLKVMDFGIAKQVSAEGLTLTGTILGTPGYMAPEQINGGQEISGACDQYAIGAVAYRLLTGTRVFEHEEIVPLLMMHVTTAAQAPSARNPDLPASLDALVLKLLAKTPAARYPTCEAVAQALEAELASLS